MPTVIQIIALYLYIPSNTLLVSIVTTYSAQGLVQLKRDGDVLLKEILRKRDKF